MRRTMPASCAISTRGGCCRKDGCPRTGSLQPYRPHSTQRQNSILKRSCEIPADWPADTRWRTNSMRILLGCVMISNAALFFFGALQHAGIAIGRFHEPRIVSATIVESLCGFSLLWGAGVVFGHSPVEWRTALIANIVPLGGVL